MKKIKVSIQDEYTLVLQEDGKKGDLIDLTSLHDVEIDRSTIKSVVNSIKKDTFNEEVEKVRISIEREKDWEMKIKEQEISQRTKDDIAKKNSEILELKSKIENADLQKRLAVKDALDLVEKERDELKVKLQNSESEHEKELKSKDEVIERYKDMKLRLSTKMVGETLEQHCEIEFNKLRATAFQNAYFEKDNDSATGSKGDYIFRENDDLGNEIVSIMFEMKNEGDDTTTKHKNEEFFQKLDKDRKEKKCEYAVLVSLLEIDNDLYNSGIVDVSYKYPKMYVIRPQFFIPIITLLKNAAMNSLKYKAELALIKNQNIDITTFEDDVNSWKSGMLNTMKNAGNKHIEAIEQINKAIKDLEKVRDSLTLSDKHLLSAENKMDELTIKRLTRGNPTMQQKFEELNKGMKKNGT